jgi:inactive STAND
MQHESNNQSLIESKKKCLKILYDKYNLANQNWATTLNGSDKPSLQLTINLLETEIEQLEGEINNLKLRSPETDSSKFYSNHERNWKEKFPKIDFHKTNKMLKSILGKFEDREGAALFLLQNSRSMGGNWCVKNLEFQLQNMGNLHSPYEFEFLPHQAADRMNFLNFLAEKFTVPPCLDEITYTDKIIDKICASLHGGYIYFIKIDVYTLASEDLFLDWFLHQFWCRLLERLPQLSQKHPLIRFVAVVSVRGSIPKDFLPSCLCCKSKNFDSKKFMELPLQKKWTQQEINNWLLKFSGITAPPMEVTKEEIERMAENIHQVTKGKPCDVYSELMDAMSKRVS